VRELDREHVAALAPPKHAEGGVYFPALAQICKQHLRLAAKICVLLREAVSEGVVGMRSQDVPQSGVLEDMALSDGGLEQRGLGGLDAGLRDRGRRARSVEFAWMTVPLRDMLLRAAAGVDYGDNYNVTRLSLTPYASADTLVTIRHWCSRTPAARRTVEGMYVHALAYMACKVHLSNACQTAGGVVATRRKRSRRTIRQVRERTRRRMTTRRKRRRRRRRRRRRGGRQMTNGGGSGAAAAAALCYRMYTKVTCPVGTIEMISCHDHAKWD
jgi:hypothetical protein